MNGTFTALKITSQEVNLAVIRHENGRRVVGGFRHIDIPPDGWPSVAQLVGETRGMGVGAARRALLVLGSEDLTYRDFSFPFGSAKKVTEAIRFEISSEFPSEEYSVDYIEVISGDPGRKAFLAAIVQKELLRRRVKEAEELGFQVTGITCDLSTLGNYFVDEIEALVMDVGQTYTLFVLYSHRIPSLVRGLSYGLKDIFGASGEIKKEAFKPLGSEIKRTIHSFNARMGLTLDKAYLSGSLLAHPSVVHTLSEGGEFRFVHEPPVAREFGVTDQDAGLNLYASLLGATGWKKGSRVFDFYREEFVGTDKAAVTRHALRWGAMVLVCFLLAWFFSSWLKIITLEKRERFLTAETLRVFSAAFPQVTKVVDGVKQARGLLEAKKGELGGSTSFSSVSILDVMETISRAIPSDVNFQVVNLFWERNRVEIDGRTDSFKTVNVIQELLSKSQGFPEVTISNAKTRSDGQDVEFKITIRLAG